MLKRDGGWRRWLVNLLSLVVVAVLWQIKGNHSSPAFLASFTATVRRVWELTINGQLFSAIGVSAQAFLIGLAISIVIGLPVGLAFARVRFLTIAVEPYVYVLYAIPVITLVPFILAFLGFGLGAKTLVVVLASIFPILISVMEGARSVPSQLLDVARAHGSSERAIWKDVLIPYTASHAVIGIRQGIAGALVGTIIAEFFLNADGVGALILHGSQDFDSAEVIGVTLVFSIIALVLMGIASWFERRVAAWREVAFG